jgi:hypothetical protein
MLKLIDGHNVPPGGWRFRIPETGIIVKGGSFDQLLINCKKHYTANTLQVPAELEQQILYFACNTYAPCENDGVANKVSRGKRPSLGFGDIIRFSKTLFNAMSSGVKVDQEEANRRASICANCQFNVEPEGCSACNTKILREAVKAVSGSGKTPFDPALQSCAHCGCFNAAQIWFPIDTLHKYTDDQENSSLPTWCWKKRQP